MASMRDGSTLRGKRVALERERCRWKPCCAPSSSARAGRKCSPAPLEFSPALRIYYIPRSKGGERPHNPRRLPGVALFPRWRKHYRDGGLHFDWHAIHQRWFVSPLQYCLDRVLPADFRAGNIFGALDSTALADEYVKNNSSIHTLVSKRRVHRWDRV